MAHIQNIDGPMHLLESRKVSAAIDVEGRAETINGKDYKL